MAFLFMLLTLIFTYPFSKLLYKVACPVTSPMNATNPELNLVDYTVSDGKSIADFINSIIMQQCPFSFVCLSSTVSLKFSLESKTASKTKSGRRIPKG